jgi:hypothetical protein
MFMCDESTHRKSFLIHMWLLLLSILHSNQEALSKVGVFQGRDYEDSYLLGCDTMLLLLEPMFLKNVSLPPSV